MSETNPRGRFVWYDLMTSDPTAAADFYSGITGWGTQQWDGGGMPYTMWTLNDAPFGGIMPLPADLAGKVPPHWMGYVAVANVDETAKEAQALGGSVLHQPMDIPTVGRFAVIADPQGVPIAIFTSASEAPGHDGPPNVGEFSWHELTALDHNVAWEFYSKLFGWEKAGDFDMGEMGMYQLYGRNGRQLGGMWTKPKDMPVPPNWMHYIRVDDLDGAVERVKALGGQVLNGPMEVPGGDRIAQCMDPQGGAFAMHATPATS